MDATTIARQLVGIMHPDDRELQRYINRGEMEHLPDNGANATTTTEAPEMPMWATMVFILIFLFIIIFTLIVRDGLCGYCGITACGSRPSALHSSQHPIPVRAGVTPEQNKERQLEKQRQERRLWYSYYLKPFLTVLTEKHFMTDGTQLKPDQKDEETPIIDLEQDRTQPASGAMCMIEDDPEDEAPFEDVDINDEETKQDSLLVCKPISDDDEEFPTKLMTIWDAHDTTFRQIEANCSICLVDYEPGDTIVRSASNEPEEHCIHVFHLDCMLAWLEHGRKRCPICRHWFVPAIRIKDQIKEAHLATCESLHHLYDARTMQDVVSLGGDTDSDTSGSFNNSDDTETDIEQGMPTEQPASPTTEEAPTESLQTPHHHPHHHHHRPNHPSRTPSRLSSPSSLREGDVRMYPEFGIVFDA